MKLRKVEHHQVDWHYTTELDEEKLGEIYPDLEGPELTLLALNLSCGFEDINQVMEDAWNQGVDIEWELDYEDVWTDRKGGYDVDYSVEEEEE